MLPAINRRIGRQKRAWKRPRLESIQIVVVPLSAETAM
jgi:hypothetical protein